VTAAGRMVVTGAVVKTDGQAVDGGVITDEGQIY
jgi:hypothetical protein